MSCLLTRSNIFSSVKMRNKRIISLDLFSKTMRAVTNSAALPLLPSYDTVSSIPTDPSSLTDQLFHRIVSHSSSVSDAFDFFTARGLDFDSSSYAALMKKLVQTGHPQLAYSFNSDCIIGRGIIPDSSIANSMLICLCKLDKLDEAKLLFDQIITDGSCIRPAFNAFFRLLLSKERYLDAFNYFVRMDKVKVNLGCWCYNLLIDGLCKKGYLEEAIQVFDSMPERTGLFPTLHLYKSLFYCLCKKGWVVKAESLFGEMESFGFFVDTTMYTSLINVYCKLKMKMATRVYSRMLKKGCKPDSCTYNILIRWSGKMSLFDQGRALYNQMLEEGLLPDVVTCQVMISNYCWEGKVDSAYKFLNQMIKNNLAPDVHCYTVLITSLFNENRVMEAEELYKSMLTGGLVPDHILFMKCKNMFPEACDAFMFLKAIAQNGCGFDPLKLSVSDNNELEQKIEILIEEILKRNLSLANVAINILVCAFCEEGKLDRALDFMVKMVDLGCMPSPFCYNSLIKCFFQKGLFENAKALLNTLQDLGIFPHQSTYLIMINEHCIRGDLVSAFAILDEIKDRGMKPAVAIYNCIIGCLCRQERMFEAEEMFIGMIESGVDPDIMVYTTLIHGYSLNGRITEACQLFDKLIQYDIKPTIHTYTALISGLVKEDMTYEGCRYLRKMLDDGLLPDVVLHTSLIQIFFQKGEIEFALRLFDLMVRNQIEASLVSYIVLVSGFCRNISSRKRWCSTGGTSEKAREKLFQLLHRQSLLPIVKKNLRVDFDSPEAMKCFALKLIQKVKQTRFMPNLYLYNVIIYGFVEADRMRDAYDHFELMQKEGVSPDSVTFNTLMAGHIKAGETDHAIGLYNKMIEDGCIPDTITYSILVKGLCQDDRLLEALSLLHVVYKRGLIPCKDSYERLLEKFCARCLGDPAFKIFEEMLVYHSGPRLYLHNLLFRILHEQKKFRETYIVK